MSRWLSFRDWKAAQAGFVLYVLGILTSGIYYAHFEILLPDLLRVQLIAVGVYVVALYGAVPLVAMWVAKQLPEWGVLRFYSCMGLIAGLDAAIWLLLGYRLQGAALAMVGTVALQLSLFADWRRLWVLVRGRKAGLEALQVPSRTRAGAMGLLICLHFSVFWFPRIPMGFEGGMPVRVQVFTKDDNLPNSRFLLTKDRPQINPTMDSYSLDLLFQTDKDMYFLEGYSASGCLVECDVMRIAREEVVRMDYVSSLWWTWR